MNHLTEILNSGHRIDEFSCGKALLDSYLHHQATQDIQQKLSACFVLNDPETNLLKGYYTLERNCISHDSIPKPFQKKLPKSDSSVPTAFLSRVAIDTRFQGKGVGKVLLVDALKRSYGISKSIGSFAVVVHPLDKDSENFYTKYGFIKLPDSRKMFLPMNTLKELFE